MEYAGFWRRAAALLLDMILTFIAVSVAFGFVLPEAAFDSSNENMLGHSWNGVVLIFGWLYYAIFESSSMQATPVKKALGLIVTNLSGERIGFGRATARYFAKFASSVILLIGYIMAAFTKRKQGLHDFIAQTLVYKAGSSAELNTSPSAFE